MVFKASLRKFAEHGSLEYRHAGGPPGLSQETKEEIVESCKNKRFEGSSRKAAAQYNVSQTTVLRVLKQSGLKSYAAQPQQKMDGRQKMNRLVFGHYSLNTHGVDLGPQGTWARLVNTDFSGLRIKSPQIHIANGEGGGCTQTLFQFQLGLS